MSNTATSAPSAPKRSAIARPMPDAAPVTMTTLSFRPRIRPSQSAFAIGPPCHHAHGLVGDHRLAFLVQDIVLGRDDAAVALRCRPHGRHLDLGMNGIARENRLQHLLLDLQQRQPRRLHRRLAQQALDDGVDQRRRRDPALDRAMALREREIREQRLDHAGDADELHDIGFRDGPIQRAEFLSRLKVIPIEANADRAHGACLSVSSTCLRSLIPRGRDTRDMDCRSTTDGAGPAGSS